MKFISPRSIIFAALSLAPALSAQASVDSNLTLELKCHTQAKLSTKGPNVYGSVRTVRIDAKQLLVLVARELGVKFPSGAQLKVATTGKVFVADSRGSEIVDVSRFFEARFENNKRLFNGSANNFTGVESSRNYFPMVFLIKLPSTLANLRGIAVEDYKVSSPDSFGVQYATGNIEAQVNGKGKSNATTALFDGSLYLRGRQAQIAP